MEKSAGCGVRPNPGSVAATTRTGAPTRASMIGSKKTAVHMPPGSSSTVHSALDGPDSRMSQSWPERRRVVWLGDCTTPSYGGLPVAGMGSSPHLSRTRCAPCSAQHSAGSNRSPTASSTSTPTPRAETTPWFPGPRDSRRRRRRASGAGLALAGRGVAIRADRIRRPPRRCRTICCLRAHVTTNAPLRAKQHERQRQLGVPVPGEAVAERVDWFRNRVSHGAVEYGGDIPLQALAHQPV